MTEQEDNLFWALAAKKIAREITSTENVQLNALLSKYPEKLYALETIGHYWSSSKEKGENHEREAALERHMARMQQQQLLPGTADDRKVVNMYTQRRRLYTGIAAASVVIVIVTIAVFKFNKTKDPPVMASGSFVKTITTLKGSRNKLVLADGSKVWLNAGSTIQYNARQSKETQAPDVMPAWSGDSTREIFLTGEAYFEITHDDKKTFVIHTSQVDIRDLGTSFNVKAYPSDNVTETTLVEGSIEVQLRNGREFKTLSKPHEKLTIRSNHRNDSIAIKDEPTKTTVEKPVGQSLKISSGIAPVEDDSTLAETAWLKGMMVFRNESFTELAVRMERWYDVAIVFEKNDFGKYRFSGTFHQETVEEALKELQAIKPFSFLINGNQITIK